jgi:hypothetical protein
MAVPCLESMSNLFSVRFISIMREITWNTGMSSSNVQLWTLENMVS